jgi:hypothetical protein
VLKGRIESAFLSVYLPSLLLLPTDYSVRIPHLPPFSAAEFALIPISMVALSRWIREGSLRLMDALVLLFWASWSASEILGEPLRNDGIFNAVSSIVSYPDNLRSWGATHDETVAVLDTLRLRSPSAQDDEFVTSLSAALSNLTIENSWQLSATSIYRTG